MPVPPDGNYVTETEVQAWLEPTKTDIAAVDTQLEGTAFGYVSGRLGERYDTSTWLDNASTPVLVRSVVAMYVAAWMYNRQYSEDDGVSEYATWLESWADTIVSQMLDGSLDIPGAVLVGTDGIPSGSPDFYPKDYNFDQYGRQIDDAVFTMGTRF